MKPKIDNSQLEEEYLSGMSTTVLARKYQRAPKSIRQRLQRMGLQLGPTGRPKLKLNSQELKKQYLAGRNLSQLAEENGCTYMTIRDRLTALDVVIKHPHNVLELNDEEIQNFYISGISVSELGQQYGCSGTTIRSILGDEMEKRRRIDAEKKQKQLDAMEQQRMLEKQQRIELCETVKSLYLSGFSMKKIAERCGFASYTSIVNILDAAGIERRSMKEWAKNTAYLEEVGNGVKAAHERGLYTEETYRKIAEKLSGENAPNWHGGKSFEPYGPRFNRTLKRYIRERDSYTCAICHDNGRSVHHVDYDKWNNLPDNLVTLCGSCHTRTGFNRQHWQTVLTPIAHSSEVNLHSLCEIPH
jgi:AraC-like DNA-binding protein